MKKLLVVILTLALVLSLSAFAEADPAVGPITLTDDLGRTVVLDEYPQRIVSLTPSNTEILCALGLVENIVGVDSSSDYPEAVSQMEVVGDYSGPNMEAIIVAEPDVVFASTYLSEEQLAAFETAEIPVVCSQVDSYEAIPEGIRLVAEAVGGDAEPVIAAMEAEKDEALAAVVAREEPLKVYFCLGFGEYGDYSAGPGTFIDSLITLAGGVNVVTDPANPWPSYSLEQLVLDDPDVILISDYIGDRTTLVEQLSAADGYKELRCVQEGHVYCVDDDTTSRPCPRINQALKDIVEILNSVE